MAKLFKKSFKPVDALAAARRALAETNSGRARELIEDAIDHLKGKAHASAVAAARQELERDGVAGSVERAIAILEAAAKEG